MIGRLDHVAHAVPDLEAARAFYRDALGAEVGAAFEMAAHGVRVAFVRLGNAEVELLEPLGEESPLRGFLQRSPAGGLHHVCFEVADLTAARAALVARGARVLGEPRAGAHGKPVLFLHPGASAGALIELVEG